jgi:hypothetical protein
LADSAIFALHHHNPVRDDTDYVNFVCAHYFASPTTAHDRIDTRGNERFQPQPLLQRLLIFGLNSIRFYDAKTTPATGAFYGSSQIALCVTPIRENEMRNITISGTGSV